MKMTNEIPAYRWGFSLRKEWIQVEFVVILYFIEFLNTQVVDTIPLYKLISWYNYQYFLCKVFKTYTDHEYEQYFCCEY